MPWSDGWLPAAREALVGLRGDAGVDTTGNHIPLLSVVDATSVLATLTKAAIVQLNRMGDGDYKPACRSYHLVANHDDVPETTISKLSTPSYTTLSAVDYLAGFPPPPGASSSKAWYRSPTNYAAWGQLGAVLGEDDAAAQQATAWGLAFSGQDPSGATGDITSSIVDTIVQVPAGVAVYAVYTLNNYDDASGQLTELRELVNCYQRACDAIAAGAVTQSDMTAAMIPEACAAFWSALLQVGASLDTLNDVPPRPPTSQVLQDALDSSAQALGSVLATAANTAGRVVGEAAKGVTEGLGVYGIAFAVGALAIFLAVH